MRSQIKIMDKMRSQIKTMDKMRSQIKMKDKMILQIPGKYHGQNEIANKDNGQFPSARCFWDQSYRPSTALQWYLPHCSGVYRTVVACRCPPLPHCTGMLPHHEPKHGVTFGSLRGDITRLTQKHPTTESGRRSKEAIISYGIIDCDVM